MAKIYITEDGNRVEATGEVLQQILDTQAEFENMRIAKEAEEAAKAEAKAALLARLGITAEEAVLLLS
jgi:hypothetical protein